MGAGGGSRGTDHLGVGERDYGTRVRNASFGPGPAWARSPDSQGGCSLGLISRVGRLSQSRSNRHGGFHLAVQCHLAIQSSPRCRASLENRHTARLPAVLMISVNSHGDDEKRPQCCSLRFASRTGGHH
jgi:hypothetical protein